MINYYNTLYNDNKLLFDNKNIIEVGAGTGLVGIWYEWYNNYDDWYKNI